MDILIRCIVLALAAFAVTHVLMSLGVALGVIGRRRAERASDHADRLLRWQVLPTVVGGLVLAFAAIGLFRFESREGGEVIGRLVWLAGGLGLAMMAYTIGQLVRLHHQTHSLVRAWLADARPLTRRDVAVPAFAINTGFPIVAIIGVLRPRLVIDEQVMRACSDDELSAILAHERGHVSRWDNLRRVAFAAVPGPWFSPDLPQAWRDATEEAADDLAAADGRDTRFHLAAALLRVSRLNPRTEAAGWQQQLPASALYRGESVERRVRRLVDAPGTEEHRRGGWTTVILVAVTAAGFAVQKELHDVMERVVAFLP